MVHIVHGPTGLQVTYCGLEYKASMPAITWQKPITNLSVVIKNTCSACIKGFGNE